MQASWDFSEPFQLHQPQLAAAYWGRNSAIPKYCAHFRQMDATPQMYARSYRLEMADLAYIHSAEDRPGKMNQPAGKVGIPAPMVLLAERQNFGEYDSGHGFACLAGLAAAIHSYPGRNRITEPISLKNAARIT
jgi:hypothetical protein